LFWRWLGRAGGNRRHGRTAAGVFESRRYLELFQHRKRWTGAGQASSGLL